MNDLNIEYIKFRMRWDYLIYKLLFLLLFVGVVLWRESIYYIIGIVLLLTIIEAVIVKCPYCGKRPVIVYRFFPAKCHHCGKALLSDNTNNITA